MRALLVAGLLMLAWLAAAPPSRAQPLLTLDIPAQALDQALDSFGRQSGLAVLVDQALLAGQRSSAVQGRYTAREGLQRLLQGTGLQARYSGSGGFTLQPLRLAATMRRNQADGVPAGGYAQVLQQAVERALCASALTRPGSYRAALQVWIDARGQIVQSRLLASTGVYARDATIIERLHAVRLDGAPPTSLAQPITLLLRPVPMDCPLSQGAAAA
ncbi:MULTISPECIES: STN domain-containing protein [unclassified Pseudomonas]|uniref:STN domain-containing protein n=1 Tax=unclassified Pseudomonas TaxID=196821 RepID=UPI0024490519|nr:MULTISPECIES: STN domain-containing protein [unclassified Pseudomonas]MDH0301510.1 STN domain-containing protein [Pseudomonas sp. GD04091]MDH1985404.1 STN domain-containing protein [Pseudomonas sp. GD03689]